MARSRFAPPAVTGPSRDGLALETRRRSGRFRPFQLGPEVRGPAANDAGPQISPEEQQRRALAEEARRDGYAQGLEQGRAQAHAEASEYLTRLADGVETLARAQAVVTEARRRELIELALAAAEALVQRDLTESETTLAHLVEVGLQTLGRSEPLSLHLHPEDVVRVSPAMHRAAASGFDVQILEDRTLARGDLRIDNALGTVESVLHDRLARVRQLIIGELDGGPDAGPAGGGEG